LDPDEMQFIDLDQRLRGSTFAHLLVNITKHA